jgi:hypothetical protein
MKYVTLIVVSIAAASGTVARSAFAHDGQYPVPPATASRAALPACGFAATQSWGQNGFQYCDARNVLGSSGGGYRSSR